MTKAWVSVCPGKMIKTGNQTDQTDKKNWEAYALWILNADEAVVANAVICLIHQANYLLDQQIAVLERDFIHEGGYSEQLAARIAERQRQKSDGEPAPAAPDCPTCGKPMSLSTARKGKRAGSQFWGCSVFPNCKGTRDV